MIRLIVVARKPLSEKSVAGNVIKHGTGGINIDATRIGTEQRTYTGSGNSPQKTENRSKGDTGVGLLDGSGRELEFKVTGRWPSNLILQHKDGCRKVGQSKQQVPSMKEATHKPNYRNTVYGKGLGGGFPPNFTNPDGTETIDQWECVEGCPVKDLGEQSGVSKSPKGFSERKVSENLCMSGPNTARFSCNGLGDTGTAARFFKQVGGQK